MEQVAVNADLLMLLKDARNALLDGRLEDLRGILVGDICSRALETAGSGRPAYAVVQEGGSSSEIYFSAFDTIDQANAHRVSCAEGGYRTSQPVEIPAVLVSEAFGPVAESLLEASLKFEYAESPEEQPVPAQRMRG